MRAPKAYDWIIGYIFGDFERKIIKYIKENNKPSTGICFQDYRDPYMRVCSVPKVLFNLKESKSKENTLRQEDADSLCKAITEELEEVFGHKFTFDIICFPENQYMTFRMKAAIKPPKKKMTLKEIEAALGYEVEIIK